MTTPRLLRLGALSALFLASTPLHAIVDLDNDTVGDIWRLRYNAAALVADADEDGDGLTNAEEAGAGTDPFSPGDSIEVRNLQLSGSSLTLHWPSVLGKRYKVQSTTELSNPAGWTDVTASYLDGTGAEMSYETTTAGTGTFYRVAVYDKDSDGDGVSDWEELAVGLDPENDHSNGLGGPADLAYLTGALTATNTLTVTAQPSNISENSLYPAAFTVRRSGNINPLTVTYTISGGATPGTDYTALTGSVVIPFGATTATITVTPLADAAIESPEAVIVAINPNAAYTIGQSGTAGILIDDVTQPNGDGLTAQFWNEVASGANQISTTNPAKYVGNPVVTRIDALLDWAWTNSTTQGVGSPAVGVNVDYWSSRWTGEIMPEFSQIYTIYFDVNTAGRVWVNGVPGVDPPLINNWPGTAAAATGKYSGVIALEGGKRYPIVVEAYDTTGSSLARLSWKSANTSGALANGDVLVPQARLFSSVAPQITSATEVLTFAGGPSFSYAIKASANPTSYAAANLPPGLSVNTATGLITGSPAQAGTWQVVLTATNSVGSGSAILSLTVLQAGGGIVREVWNGIPGSTMANFPLGTAPSATSTLTSLQGPTNDGDSYAARIRGYVTAPATGVYQFFLRADHAAELYISDDDEPVNSWKRAELLAPVSDADWSGATLTPLLYLKAGSRYYLEVRHKEDAGNDHLAIGWSKPGEPTTAPSEIIPGYLLTQFAAPVPTSGESTLYTTSLTSQGTAITTGNGNATLQVSADRTEAVLHFNYANLTGNVTQKHIHSGADGGLIMFDLDTATPASDGSYTWSIATVAGVSDKDGDGDSDAADVIRLIENGDAYLNLHTAVYPAGEIKGFLRLQAGSQIFTPPAPAPSYPDDHNNDNAAARFLQQTTFGVRQVDINNVKSMGYEGWIDDQFTKPASHHMVWVEKYKNVTDPGNATYPTALTTNGWWQNSIEADDQLRQRVAFALSQILVTSTAGPLEDRANAVSDYYDSLLDDAFGNFRTLLENVTLHPAMGRYLDMLRNDKPNKTTGQIPNENYAREVMQLFSIGLNRMHPDGSLVLNSKGLPIPTYDQDAIVGVAHVFTGWDYNYAGAYRTSFGASSNWVDPMREVPVRHFTGQKRVLNNIVLPGLPAVGGVPLDPYASHGSTIYNDPAYQALPALELDAVHDQLFNHPNCAPFICRQLIQRLVTSTPSRGYIYRVVQKFENNGSGVRGDMQAVIKAVLLDYEARSPVAMAAPAFGKQREPLLRVTQIARSFTAPTPMAGTYTQTDNIITVTVPAGHHCFSGQTLTLDFSNPPANTASATDGTYSITSSVPITATQFSMRAKDVLAGTYTQVDGTNILTVTTTSNHGLVDGDVALVKFNTAATGTLPANATFVVDVGTATNFTITMPDTTARTGNTVVAFLKGGYTMPYPGAVSTPTTVTIATTTVHGLHSGDVVKFRFDPDQGTMPPDGEYAITVTDDTHFTFSVNYPATGSATLTGDFVAGTLNHPLTHSGDVTTAFSTYNVGGTDTNLGQTPLRSPTVFNYFEPDYQYSGVIVAAQAIAQANGQPPPTGLALTTPEFQLTSETNVVRQSNYLSSGILNPNNTAGFCSFASGGGAITFDISQWMQNRPATSTPWTSHDTANPTNDNLRNLIRQLSTLLMAGQMSTEMENRIYTYVADTTKISYTLATPTETQKRDRVRAVLQFIVTSPEFTIQK